MEKASSTLFLSPISQSKHILFFASSHIIGELLLCASDVIVLEGSSSISTTIISEAFFANSTDSAITTATGSPTCLTLSFAIAILFGVIISEPSLFFVLKFVPKASIPAFSKSWAKNIFITPSSFLAFPISILIILPCATLDLNTYIYD